jgi:RNA polymerase sigma factor (sigma-70 family)
VEATSVARPHGLRLPKPRRVLAALSDERLVDHVRRGDDVAFEVLYDRHQRGILAFCRHMLRSADEAEDAVQHVFIAAYNDLQRDQRDIRLKAWLYTIARNRCLSMLRARREQASDDIELSTDRLSEDVQQRVDLQVLLADIGRLPDDQREALVLSEVGDMSHAEVAQVIGCEASKVKSLVFQARSALVERRQARETPCEQIREQIATLRGGALRRSHLRHHIEACPGCAQYRESIRRQRQMLALALPVLPSLGLRHQVLAAVGVGGGGAGGAAIGGGFGLAAKSGLAKVGIAALVAGGGAGATVAAVNGGLPHLGGGGAGAVEPATATPAAAAANASAKPGSATQHSSASHSLTGSGQPRHGRSDSGVAHGFSPTQGTSNGSAAQAFAKTRGKHTGLTRSQSNHGHSAAPHRTTTHVSTPKPAQRHIVAHVRTTPVQHPTPAPAPKQAQPDPTTTTAPESTTPSPTPPAGSPRGAGGVVHLSPPAGG